jgi:hypothetical protein
MGRAPPSPKVRLLSCGGRPDLWPVARSQGSYPLFAIGRSRLARVAPDPAGSADAAERPVPNSEADSPNVARDALAVVARGIAGELALEGGREREARAGPIRWGSAPLPPTQVPSTACAATTSSAVVAKSTISECRAIVIRVRYMDPNGRTGMARILIGPVCLAICRRIAQKMDRSLHFGALFKLFRRQHLGVASLSLASHNA